MSDPATSTAVTTALTGATLFGAVTQTDYGVIFGAFAGTVYYVATAADVPLFRRGCYFLTSFIVGVLGAQVAGVSQNIVQIAATDDTGAPLVGHVVTLSVDSGTVTPTSAATDANSAVSAALVSSVAGTVTLTALLEDGVTTASIPVEFASFAQPAPVAVAPVQLHRYQHWMQ
ncbi:putative holin [Mangrovibacter phragmitis]|uniref:putative holin n=1 Tax=Mangrovibacter phragmitis TaxID=1691903 RepID=UPI0035197F51